MKFLSIFVLQKHVKQSIMTEFQEKVLKLIEEGKSPSEIKRFSNLWN